MGHLEQWEQMSQGEGQCSPNELRQKADPATVNRGLGKLEDCRGGGGPLHSSTRSSTDPDRGHQKVDSHTCHTLIIWTQRPPRKSRCNTSGPVLVAPKQDTSAQVFKGISYSSYQEEERITQEGTLAANPVGRLEDLKHCEPLSSPFAVSSASYLLS